MFLLFALGIAHIVAGLLAGKCYFRPGNRTELLLVSGLLGFVTFYMVPIAVGWTTGFMNCWVIAAGFGAAFTSAGFAVLKLKKRKTCLDAWETPIFRDRFWLEWPIITIGMLLLLLLLTAGSVLPARYADAIGYHMSNPMSWHRTGHFILESYGEKELSEQAVSAECAPNVKALLPFLVMLITNDTPGTALAQFPFLLLLIVTVRALALRMGVRYWIATLVAVATISIPEVFFQAIEVYSDVMFLCGQMVVIWSLVHLWQEKLTWKSIFYPAIGFGIMAGAKSAFIASGGILGILYGILLLAKCVPIYGKKTPTFVGAAFLLTVLAFAATGAPWFVHAWQKFDNPVYPIKVRVGEKIVFDGRFEPTVNDEMMRSFTGVDGIEAYWNTLQEKWRSPNLNNWAGGLGACMFICGLPGLALFFAGGLWSGTGVNARRILFASGALLTLACPTLAVVRFTLYQPVIAFLALGWLFTVFPVVLRSAAVALMCTICLYDLFMNTSSIVSRPRPAELTVFNLVSGYPRCALLDAYPAQYTALDYWREEISKPGLVLGLPPFQIPVWLTYAPWSPSNILRYRHPRGNYDAREWHAELLAHGVTHLYVTKSNPGFDVALANPDLFGLLIRRLDSQFGAGAPYYVVPYPEDALFDLKTESGK